MRLILKLFTKNRFYIFFSQLHWYLNKSSHLHAFCENIDKKFSNLNVGVPSAKTNDVVRDFEKIPKMRKPPPHTSNVVVIGCVGFVGGERGLKNFLEKKNIHLERR